MFRHLAIALAILSCGTCPSLAATNAQGTTSNASGATSNASGATSNASGATSNAQGATTNAQAAASKPSDLIQQTRLNGFMRNTKILRGLTTISVTVSKLDPWMVSRKVTPDSLTAAATEKLVAAGIKVVPGAQPKSHTSNLAAPAAVPILYIRLKTIATPSGDSASYSMQMSLVDSVVTKRNAHELLVSVWDTVDVGRVEANMTTEIIEALNQQLSDFIQDWSKENAKASLH